MRQAIIWTNTDPIHWRIYATPGGDALTFESLSLNDITNETMLPSYIIGTDESYESYINTCV